MSLTVLADARRRPRRPAGTLAVAATDLRAWLDSISYSVPDALIELWRTVGGGELFESKEVYAPDGTDDDPREARFTTFDDWYRRLLRPSSVNATDS